MLGNALLSMALAILATTATAHTNASSTALAPTAAGTGTLPLSTGTTSTANSTSPYKLVASLSGPTFFDSFESFTGPDPTNGHVNYTSMLDAASERNLAFLYNSTTNETTAYMGVDFTHQAPAGRNSVRISSKQTFSVGMIAVMDVRHVPTGSGTWPAAWFLGTGADWPAAGESDWLEWVDDGPETANAMTLHTAPGCSVRNTSDAFQGRLQHTDCNESSGGVGCGISAKTDATGHATAGAAFNAAGGAVYVHQWTTAGFTTWMFAHGALPADLAPGATPNPDAWVQEPLAKHSGSGCDFAEKFRDMVFVLDTTFCGDWAGKVWDAAGGGRSRTKVATCAEYVSDHPKAFEDAYWEIASLRIWSSGEEPGVAAPVMGKRELPGGERKPEFAVMPRHERVRGAGVWSNTRLPPSPPLAAEAARHVHGEGMEGKIARRCRARRVPPANDDTRLKTRVADPPVPNSGDMDMDTYMRDGGEVQEQVQGELEQRRETSRYAVAVGLLMGVLAFVVGI